MTLQRPRLLAGGELSRQTLRRGRPDVADDHGPRFRADSKAVEQRDSVMGAGAIHLHGLPELAPWRNRSTLLVDPVPDLHHIRQGIRQKIDQECVRGLRFGEPLTDQIVLLLQ